MNFYRRVILMSLLMSAVSFFIWSYDQKQIIPQESAVQKLSTIEFNGVKIQFLNEEKFEIDSDYLNYILINHNHGVQNS